MVLLKQVELFSVCIQGCSPAQSPLAWGLAARAPRHIHGTETAIGKILGALQAPPIQAWAWALCLPHQAASFSRSALSGVDLGCRLLSLTPVLLLPFSTPAVWIQTWTVAMGLRCG